MALQGGGNARGNIVLLKPLIARFGQRCCLCLLAGVPLLPRRSSAAMFDPAAKGQWIYSGRDGAPGVALPHTAVLRSIRNRRERTRP